MKANAKKLLALILAMVMCLSLAAPAMAAGGDAVTLAVQATATVNKKMVKENGITISGDKVTVKYTEKIATATDATPTDTDGQAEFTLGKTAEYPEFVTVTSKTTDLGFKVGGFKQETFWTVTANDGNWVTGDNKKAPTASTTLADDQKVYTLEDVTSWSELSNSQNWQKTSTGVDERSGFFYQEKKDDQWNYYFKLNAIKDSKVGSTTVKVFDKDAKVYYTKASGTKELKEDKDIRDALFASKVVELNGSDATAGKEFYKDRTIDANQFTLSAATYNSNAYNADFVNFDADDFTVTDNSTEKAKIGFKSATKMYATFDVRLDVKVTIGGQEKTLIVSDADVIKEEVTKKLSGATIDQISATATNGYWTVTVKKGTQGGGSEVKSFEGLKDNTAYFSNAYATVTISGNDGWGIGLKDLDKDGSFYYKDNVRDTEKKVRDIDKGTKVLGPVAIKKDDLPSEVATPSDLKKAADGTEYYVAPSLSALQNLTCIAKKVPYTQLVLNPIVNGKDNDAVEGANFTSGGVTVSGYAAKADWVTLIGKTGANIMTVSDTYALAGNSEKHVIVTEYSEKAATCKQKGARTSQAVCKHCGKTLATDVEEIPVVTVAVARNDVAGSNYKFTKAEYEKSNYAKTQSTPHYISDFTITKTAATKTAAGTMTTHYFCNLGEEHEELATTVEVAKVDLEYGDVWSYVVWGNQNTQYNRDPSSLYGYSPMIFDYDKELTTVPMTEDAYWHFEWVGNAGGSANLQPDGTYYGVANAKKSGTSSSNYAMTPAATYFATATVSNIKLAEKDCLDGSATVTLQVYKKLYTNSVSIDTAEQLAKAIAEKKVEAVTTATQVKEIVIPASKTHVDANNDGKCDNCGTEIKQATPDVPTTDKVLTLDMVTVKNLTWTGKKQQPDVTVKAADGTELEEGIDYDVATFKKTDVGTYTITVKGKGDWTGKVKATVKINKAKATLKKKSAPATLTANKKKAVTGQIKMTVTGGKVAKYKVTKKVAGVSVNKSGKITVKKNNKKAGTLKVKVTMKADKNHTAAKAVTVKVAIKAAKK